jgi:hypothetical protein
VNRTENMSTEQQKMLNTKDGKVLNKEYWTLEAEKIKEHEYWTMKNTEHKRSKLAEQRILNNEKYWT